jgi:hypothetical protein
MRVEQQQSIWGFESTDDPRLAYRKAAAEAQRTSTADEPSVDADRMAPDAEVATESRELVTSGAGGGDGE